MSWQSHNDREDQDNEDWRKLPLRERYDWVGIAQVLLLVAAMGLLLWRR